jgi:single-stranded DNA-binding protein
MKRGGDVFYGEMTGDYASKNRDTQYQQGQAYVVKGYWKHRTWQDQQGQQRHENMFYITDIQAL